MRVYLAYALVCIPNNFGIGFDLDIALLFVPLRLDLGVVVAPKPVTSLFDLVHVLIH